VREDVIELTTIVALDGFDGATKLCEDICENVIKWKSVKFNVQRKSPHKIGVIIKDNQIIFVARYANNRRGPQITMD
jgi:hypothetical protein